MAIVKIRPRRDTAANWTSVNPTLAEGEVARETDTGRIKYGDGVTAWNALPYWELPAGDIDGAVAIANGGTGATNAAGARGNLGLGSAAQQDVSAFVPAANNAAGIYTPTLTGVTNVTSSIQLDCQYLRVGFVVHVSGGFYVTPTATGLVRIGISLPVPSDFWHFILCAGSGGVHEAGPQGVIIADPTNNRAELAYTAVAAANQVVVFHMTYSIY